MFNQKESSPAFHVPTWCVDFYGFDVLCLLGSVSRYMHFLSPSPNRDLIKKLLVVDRTRRLGNMKVGACVHDDEMVSMISSSHWTLYFHIYRSKQRQDIPV